MGEIVVMRAEELRSILADFAAEVRHRGADISERPVSVNQAAKHFGMDDQRLRNWCEYGCDVCGEKPRHFMTSDQRGLKVYLSRTREWMEKHRVAGGCRG